MFGVCTVFSGGPRSDLSLCKHCVAEGDLAKKEIIAGCGLEVGITSCVSGCPHGGEASRGVCGWGIKPKVVIFGVFELGSKRVTVPVFRGLRL